MSLNVEGLSEQVREPFGGLVLFVRYNCNCSFCEKGAEKLREQGGDTDRGRIHIAVKPLNGAKIQHAWYTESKLLWSGFGAFAHAINKIGVKPTPNKSTEEQVKELAKIMEGQAFVWSPVKTVHAVSQFTGKEVPDNLPQGIEKSECWIPTKAVKEDELENYGVTDAKAFYDEAKREWEEGSTGAEEEDKEVDETDIFSDV